MQPVFGLVLMLSVPNTVDAAVVLARGVAMEWTLQLLLSPNHRTCRISSTRGNVRIEMAADRLSVWVGIDNQPGSLRYLRINRDMFVSSDDRFSGDEAARIVERLRRPGEVSFEWAARPNWAKRQGLFKTGNFATRLEACKSWLGGIQT